MRHAASLVVFASGLFAFLLSESQTSGADQDQFEERLFMRCAERSAERTLRAGKGDRALWLKALEAAYPDKMTPKILNAATEEDYGAWFDLLASKNDEWKRDDAPNTQISELYDKTIQRLELGPVPSLKREEFMRFAKRSLVPNSPGNQNNQGGDVNEDADRAFRVLDRNTDGELESEEFTLSLKEEKVRSDADGNGRISKEEYREYFRKKVATKVETVTAKLNGETGRTPDAKGSNKAGNGLPDWFTKLDGDKDMQVSLFEWREGKKPTEIFQEMDLNSDGLLTRDEYLRYIRLREIELNQKKREDEKK